MRFCTICENCGTRVDFENKKQVKEYLKNHKHSDSTTILIYHLKPEFLFRTINGEKR